MNKNTEYEILTKEIYKEILREEGFKNIEVLHNQKIKGQSGIEHQIDVYWSFNMGGIEHKVVIECKNYKERVSKDKIQSFNTVVSDLSARGIFVAKSGYQSGAKKLADYFNIELKEITTPELYDWKGHIREFEYNIKITPLKIEKMEILFDINWMKKIYKEKIKFNIQGYNGEIFLKNENDKKIESLRDLENKLPRNQDITEYGKIYNYDYRDKNRYLNDKDGKVIKVKGIKYTYDSFVYEDFFKIDYRLLIKGIIKDVKTKEVKFINK